MNSYLSFLREKTRSYSLLMILKLEIEALTLGFLSLIPTTFGIVLRAIACKLLFKELSGFAWIQPGCVFVNTNRLSVGTHFGVNSGTYINAIGEIQIGNHVLIGSNVTISSGIHPTRGDFPIFSRPTIPTKITINDDVWIGAGAVILPGVTLAKGTVIGANAVVTQNTEEYCIYVGLPARKIKTRLIDE